MAALISTASLNEEYTIVNLIEEIESRPALYKKSLKEYNNVKLKVTLWEEVCEAVVPDWKQLDAQAKIKQSQDVQKKWANLRTCFRRELNTQKNTSGKVAKKRRKYVYFDNLLFLLPHLGNSQTKTKYEQDILHENFINCDKITPSTSTSIRRRNTDHRRTTAPAQWNGDDTLNDSNTVDEDRSFALSLVSSLRDLTPEEKLDAKIGILNIFKEIRIARNASNISCPSKFNSSNL